MADHTKQQGKDVPVHVTPGRHAYPYQQSPATPAPYYQQHPAPVKQVAVAPAHARRPTIVLRGLQHAFAHFALNVPQLDIMPGELTYIGGASGSGKSTLLKVLALELMPAVGNIWMLDQFVRTLPAQYLDNLRGGGLTYIAQGHMGLTDNTAIQNIQRVLYDYDGIPWEEAGRQAQSALALAGLPSHCFAQRIKSLSGGEQARVAIAKVYARGRPICLADEILPSLDEHKRLDILRLLQRLAAAGFTVVLVAHQPELKSYFHRVVEMRTGQIIGDERHAPTYL
jgi:ABC-type lipoprotein export system ATPase subunit